MDVWYSEKSRVGRYISFPVIGGPELAIGPT